MLSVDERARAARFRFEKDRRLFTLGRAALRLVLAAYGGGRADALQFDYGEFGKPALRQGGHAHSVTFNASGSQGLVAIAVGSVDALGVDIECIRRFDDWSQIVSQFFAAGEREALFKLPAQRQLEAFFHCWTAKEAVLKALGQGLQRGLDQFEVSVDPLAPPRLKWLRSEPADSVRSLRTFQVQGRALVALASAGAISEVRAADVPETLQPALLEWRCR